MSRKKKYLARFTTAICAAGIAVTMAPISRAQAQSTADSATQSSADTQQRLQDLEKQVSILESEISSMKDSDAPGLKTASMTEPIAQAATPAAAPDKVTLAGLLGPVTFSGFVDAYYAFNFNQPSDLGDTGPSGLGGNELRFFDANTNQFSLNAVELVVDKAADATAGGTGRAGFHVGVIYGQAAEAINGVNTGTTDSANIALKEAYVDYIAPVGKGLTVTVGKFVTPAGAEVIESNGNWNYSRSILFYYTIPYFHFGASAKYTFNPQWTVTAYAVNNWNGTQQVNTGKTYGVSVAYTPNKYWAITENYLAGPQDDVALGTGYIGKPNDNWRQLSDTIITYTPNAKWAFMVNGDYDYGDKFNVGDGGVSSNSKPVSWGGAAGYVKYTLSPKAYLAARYEYYDDPEAFGLCLSQCTGDYTVQEATGTFSYNWTDQLQTRAEFRDDFANKSIFSKGSERAVSTQPIAEISFIYTFSSANAKF